MLALRPLCEHCGKILPAESTEAMICSFECTFCEDCVNTILNNVCPNCGGGLEKRPIRPKEKLVKYPATNLKIHNPVKANQFEALRVQYQNIPPAER
jgi:hypothetical protein